MGGVLANLFGAILIGAINWVAPQSLLSSIGPPHRTHGQYKLPEYSIKPKQLSYKPHETMLHYNPQVN